MKQTILIYCIIINVLSSYDQQYRTIDIFYTFENKINIRNFDVTLKSNQFGSLCIIKDNISMGTVNFGPNGEIILSDELPENYDDLVNTYFYKDYSTNFLFAEEEFGDKKIKKKKKMDLFDWLLTNDSEEILGYKCTKAVCKFRGRCYEAWFTTDLPFKAAPWKFHGLPGVILKVETDDKRIKFLAQSVDIKNDSKIEYSLKDRIIMSYKDFCIAFKKNTKQMNEKLKAFSAQNNLSYTGLSQDYSRLEIID